MTFVSDTESATLSFLKLSALESWTNIVFLDYFLKPRIIQLGELRQIMYICNDIAQIGLQQLEVLFRRHIFLPQISSVPIRSSSFWASLIQLSDDMIDLSLASFYSSHDLFRFYSLE